MPYPLLVLGLIAAIINAGRDGWTRSGQAADAAWLQAKRRYRAASAADKQMVRDGLIADLRARGFSDAQINDYLRDLNSS